MQCLQAEHLGVVWQIQAILQQCSVCELLLEACAEKIINPFSLRLTPYK